MDLSLKDKVVIVAAASHGLGKACAEGFAAEGAKLAICSRSDKAIHAAADEIQQKHGAACLALPVDVTDHAAVKQFVHEVAQHYGRIDVCVANAGGPPSKGFLATSEEEWRRAFELNFLSTVHFAHNVIPVMQRNRFGRIITITSLSVKQPITGLVYSNAIRAGVVGLVKSLANEFGRDGITVNNVGPGYTSTARLRELASARAEAEKVSEDDIFRRWGQDTATGRIARPEEVASAVLWLASESAAQVTGQTILVDGGSYRGVM
jgi:3-oxoacyl-[acyl-carrier protein] reductase